MVGGVYPLIDFKGLHDDEESDGEYMSQNETLCNSNDFDDEGESDRTISEYNDIDDDVVLTSSSVDEEDLFVDERMKKIVEEIRKKRSTVYDPRIDHATLKLKVMQRYKDGAECKL